MAQQLHTAENIIRIDPKIAAMLERASERASVDLDYIAEAKAFLREWQGPVPTLEEIRDALSSISRSMAEFVVAERDEL